MHILFLSPWFLTPAVNGSKIRIYHLLLALAGIHEVRLISFVRPGEVMDLDAAQTLCQQVKTIHFREFRPAGWRARLGYFSTTPRSIVDTYSPAMAEAVLKQAGWADCVIASEIVTAPYALQLKGVPKVLDDLELAGGMDTYRQARGFKRLRRWLTWQKTSAYARRLLPGFQAVTVVSEIEKAILEGITPAAKQVRVLPNGVDTDHNHPGIASPVSGKLVYSGSLTYSANYDAVRFFLSEIFPLVQQAQPETYLEITGSTQGVDLSGLSLSSQVRLTGFVADIRPVVASAWACVVPLRQGSGTRLKILEAMALGIPVVSTSKGAEGLGVTPEQDILIADEPADFARQVVRLLVDAELHSQLALQGRQLVEQRYSWAQIGADFRSLLDESIH